MKGLELSLRLGSEGIIVIKNSKTFEGETIKYSKKYARQVQTFHYISYFIDTDTKLHNNFPAKDYDISYHDNVNNNRKYALPLLICISDSTRPDSQKYIRNFVRT